MRIAIDMTALLPQATGIDVYIVKLVQALSALDQSNRYYLIMNVADRSLLLGRLSGNFSILPICFRPRLVRLLVQQVIIPLLSLVLRVDVVHSPSFVIPLAGAGSKHFLTIHDMTSFSHGVPVIASQSSSLTENLDQAGAHLGPRPGCSDNDGQTGYRGQFLMSSTGH